MLFFFVVGVGAWGGCRSVRFGCGCVVGRSLGGCVMVVFGCFLRVVGVLRGRIFC